MQPVTLAEGIYWVGVVDWNIRYFHGPAYTTHRGTTYNAYLIVDDKVALVDSVYSPFSSQLLENISALVDPDRIDYVIVNHTEKDHAGSFPEVMRAAPRAKVFCTNKGHEFLRSQFQGEWDVTTVKTGDTLPLGRYTLSFIEAPMLHWPDSMFTYVQGAGILMPNDAFGQHLASTGRFDDQVNSEQVREEAAKYYANILLPLSDLVLRKLEAVGQMNLDLKMIAPSHGIIWRDNPGRILEDYTRWARGDTKAKAVVAYDTMWLSTEKMAHAILEGLVNGGVEAMLFKASVSDHNDIIKEILDARGVLIGSPTINNGFLAAISPLLDDLMGLKPKSKLGVAFGSYGWGGGAVKSIEQRLAAAKIELLESGLGLKWVPTAENLAACRELGSRMAAAILERQQ